MSDLMRPMEFSKMMNRIIREYREFGSIYNVKKIYKHENEKSLKIFGNKLENPLGVAAGPHTQLAHNIVADYAAGSRFIELKTVQHLYGEELGIPRPCIRAEDEAYNVEWSSEFRADYARDEYVKAYMACKIVAKEFGFGDPDGFIFNMSCGYNLEGIKKPLVDEFIETLKDASNTEVFKDCQSKLLSMVDKFENVDEEFIKSISPNVCNSMTLSTMHGCPPKEIEDISTYLLKEKKINLYIKCNPTLLGYDYVRKTLDDMGYDYIKFGHEQFEHDLQLEQAVPMIKRLKEIADSQGLEFGVKLTNTFQTKIDNLELPGNDMYMSGKALYPLSIAVAKILGEAFDGDLRVSYSGGADKNNIEEIFNAGIWPITVCTILLKPMGLDNNKVLADKLANCEYKNEFKLDVEKISKLAEDVKTDKNYIKTDAMRKKYDKHVSYEWKDSDNYVCRVLCKNCVRVCPNRTNEVLKLKDKEIILHIDSICNECGNCQFFCVEPCKPYRDRITLFDNLEDFENSTNQGFYFDGSKFNYRFNGEIKSAEYDLLPDELKEIYDAIMSQMDYLI